MPQGPPQRRVLMLAKGLGRGGAERLLAGTARHLDRSRFEVEMAYLLPWKDAFVPDVEAAGVPVHLLDGPRLWDPRWLARLRRLVRERDIDLVHTHMPLPGALARLALRGPRAPVFVHTEHNLWGRYRRPTRWLNAATFGRNAEAIAVSEGVAGSMHTRVPVRTVLHGVDVDALPHGPAARQRARRLLQMPDTPDAPPIVGTVGNFTPKKDQATLLRAMSAVVRTGHPDARLVLVGTGPLEGQLRGQARDLGAERSVLFTGMRDDVFDLLCGFDAFVLSSRFEGLPIALLEAMGCGVPPVATSVGGIPEVLADGHDGLLVPPGDDAALAAALSKLLSDDALRSELGAAARHRARDFDLARAVRTLEDLYDRVLA